MDYWEILNCRRSKFPVRAVSRNDSPKDLYHTKPKVVSSRKRAPLKKLVSVAIIFFQS